MWRCSSGHHCHRTVTVTEHAAEILTTERDEHIVCWALRFQPPSQGIPHSPALSIGLPFPPHADGCHWHCLMPSHPDPMRTFFFLPQDRSERAGGLENDCFACLAKAKAGTPAKSGYFAKASASGSPSPSTTQKRKKLPFLPSPMGRKGPESMPPPSGDVPKC